MVRLLKPCFIELSMNTFSSHVMETCLEGCDAATRHELINYLCDREELKHLLFDAYGNFVFQRIVSHSEGSHAFDRLITIVADNKENLRADKFGKKII